MKVQVEFWGVTRRLAGVSQCEIEVSEASEVLSALLALPCHAAIAGELERCAFAIGTELVPPSHRLSDGDTIAVLPPVSGG